MQSSSVGHVKGHGKRSLGWIGKIVASQAEKKRETGFFHSLRSFTLELNDSPPHGTLWADHVQPGSSPGPSPEGHEGEQSGGNSLGVIKVLCLLFFPERNIFLPGSRREGPAGLGLT